MELLLYGALILAQLGTSVKQFAMKRCGQRTPGAFNSVCINMARSLICLVVGAVIWLTTDGGATTPFGHFIIVVSGIGTALNLFTWILSSRLVSLTLIECVSMIGSLVVPLILAPYLYAGDTVSPVQWVGCALIFVSTFLFVNPEKTQKKKEGSPLQKVGVVLLCAVGAMVAAIFKKFYTYHITAKGLGSIEYFTFISFVTVLVVFLVLFAVYYIAEHRRVRTASAENAPPTVALPYKKVWFYILLAAGALYVNELFTSYAAQLPSAIYYPLARGLVVCCTFFLDVLVFKDKVTVKKLIGLVTVVVAIVLVNL